MRNFTIGILAMAASIGLAARQTPAGSPQVASSGMLLMREVNPTTGTSYGTVPAALVNEARRRLANVADVAVFGMASEAVYFQSTTPEPRRLSASEVTPGALAIVGVLPILGREFLESDLNSDTPTAIVTYNVWQGFFGSRPDVIGAHLWTSSAKGGAPVLIVGVLPRDFFLRVRVADPEAEVFVPARKATTSDGRSWPPVLRLRPGVTVPQVTSLVEAAWSTARAELPGYSSDVRPRLDPADRPGWMKY